MAKDDALKAQRDQIAMAIGHTLAEWSLVEVTLAFVFVSLMDRTKKSVAPGQIPWDQEERGRRLAHTAFNAVQAFDARVDMVSAVVRESGLNKDLRSLWPGIAERLTKKSKSRNQIAHFMISNIQQKNGTWKACVTPFATSVGEFSETRFGCSEINQKSAAFLELCQTLAWFGTAVEIARGRHKEPLGPEPPVVQRVRQSLRNRKRQAPSPPPVTSRV